MGLYLSKLHELGLTLPAPLKLPPHVKLPFPFVNIRGDRAIVSGHGPQASDGSISAPFGKVGSDVSLDEAYVLARQTGLSILASLQRELGDLDRIAAWARVFGMVNTAPDFDKFPAVINGFSDLILDVFGQEAGRHARSAIGVAGLPFGIAVEIEAEVVLKT